jgi:hypothetical protein
VCRYLVWIAYAEICPWQVSLFCIDAKGFEVQPDLESVYSECDEDMPNLYPCGVDEGYFVEGFNIRDSDVDYETQSLRCTVFEISEAGHVPDNKVITTNNSAAQSLVVPDQCKAASGFM